MSFKTLPVLFPLPSCCTVSQATAGTVQVHKPYFTFYQNVLFILKTGHVRYKLTRRVTLAHYNKDFIYLTSQSSRLWLVAGTVENPV